MAVFAADDIRLFGSWPTVAMCVFAVVVVYDERMDGFCVVPAAAADGWSDLGDVTCVHTGPRLAVVISFYGRTSGTAVLLISVE